MRRIFQRDENPITKSCLQLMAMFKYEVTALCLNIAVKSDQLLPKTFSSFTKTKFTLLLSLSHFGVLFVYARSLKCLKLIMKRAYTTASRLL